MTKQTPAVLLIGLFAVPLWAQYTETVLATAAGKGKLDTGVVMDTSGNLYGAMQYSQGGGMVYKIDTAGVVTALRFESAEGGYGKIGYYPQDVTLDAAGNIYGAAAGGGAFNAGTIFKIYPNFRHSVLYNFAGPDEPAAGVTLDAAGNIYGTTWGTGGGSFCLTSSSCGTVYKLDKSGAFTVLYRFTGGDDGANPSGHLLLDAAGNIYGTTKFGGTAGMGVVYRIDSTGETVLHTFIGGDDGAYPQAGVVMDGEANLYGAAYQGGPAGAGVLYKLDPSLTETILYTFTGSHVGETGSGPSNVIYSDGDLYGAVSSGGVVGAGYLYRFNIAAGVRRTLFGFSGHGLGGRPQVAPISDAAGNLYGTTSGAGGFLGNGLVYKLTP